MCKDSFFARALRKAQRQRNMFSGKMQLGGSSPQTLQQARPQESDVFCCGVQVCACQPWCVRRARWQHGLRCPGVLKSSHFLARVLRFAPKQQKQRYVQSPWLHVQRHPGRCARLLRQAQQPRHLLGVRLLNSCHQQIKVHQARHFDTVRRRRLHTQRLQTGKVLEAQRKRNLRCKRLHRLHFLQRTVLGSQRNWRLFSRGVPRACLRAGSVLFARRAAVRQRVRIGRLPCQRCRNSSTWILHRPHPELRNRRVHQQRQSPKPLRSARCLRLLLNR